VVLEGSKGKGGAALGGLKGRCLRGGSGPGTCRWDSRGGDDGGGALGAFVAGVVGAEVETAGEAEAVLDTAAVAVVAAEPDQGEPWAKKESEPLWNYKSMCVQFLMGYEVGAVEPSQIEAEGVSQEIRFDKADSLHRQRVAFRHIALSQHSPKVILVKFPSIGVVKTHPGEHVSAIRGIHTNLTLIPLSGRFWPYPSKTRRVVSPARSNHCDQRDRRYDQGHRSQHTTQMAVPTCRSHQNSQKNNSGDDEPRGRKRNVEHVSSRRHRHPVYQKLRNTDIL
jgi:hypothetical protein